MTPIELDCYGREGYVLLRNVIDTKALNLLEAQIMDLVEDVCERRFSTLSDPAYAAFLLSNREMERRLYDIARTLPWCQTFSSHRSIVNPVAKILGQELGLLEKIPLRFDLPMVMRELAVWHQDHHYVKGNTDIVTAWIPLQDTSYDVGCLMVMPGSHKMGVVEHDKMLLQKKQIPSGVFEREVRYVEMKRGDLLLFNSLLLHSSGINISDRIRMSVQARYSRIGDLTDSSMGRLFKLEQ